MLIIPPCHVRKKCRCVKCSPGTDYFKPRGIPLSEITEIVLNLDELEALKLADYEGLYHEQASLQMNVSRATFGRILDGARLKIAEAIINGCALRIEKK
jgi:predicted DNA-binding protein (UPF0251 family)